MRHEKIFRYSIDFPGLFGVQLSGSGSYSWSHSVTPEFQIPYDTLNSAILTIGAWSVSDSNDSVYVE